MTRRGQEDHNYRRAKQDGYAARSVYKLQELDSRYHFLRAGLKVLDLGCHPGSWLQYCAQRVGAGGFVEGVDLQPLKVELVPQARFLRADILALDAGCLSFEHYDLVISDAAPRTTGVPHADGARSAELTAKALSLACDLLTPGGNFAGKIYWSQEGQELLRAMKKFFSKTKAHKPAGSQAASRETYLIGLNFK
jgi:23S rRNA (uridine2552-2'-O)-methyltransferase